MKCAAVCLTLCVVLCFSSTSNSGKTFVSCYSLNLDYNGKHTTRFTQRQHGKLDSIE
jgi:hypothetical protein